MPPANKKYLLASVFLGIGAIALAFLINNTTAQSGSETKANIQYPAAELGNCASEQACKTYCDKPSNSEACLNFAEKHGLMSVQEIDAARKFLDAGAGPGGCKTKDACETYCDSVAHIDECVAFAEKNGLMPPAELAEAKKIQAAKARGVKMPACGGKKQCDAYCSDPANMEECIAFAQEAGFMSPKELEESQKMLAAIKKGAKPPPCRGKNECDAYCSQEEHFDSCLDFALAAGFMDPKDVEMAKKTKGKGPGGCRGKEECDAFCQQEGNMATCAQFAYENGMMSKEDFEMMKKTGGKGPGGCKSREECQNFCDNPDNQETCMKFAEENGMISEGDAKRMEQVKQQFKEMLQNVPPEVLLCIESKVGAETMAKLKSGEMVPPKDMGDKMGGCFQQNMKPRGPGGPGEGGSMPPGEPRGPAGENTPGSEPVPPAPCDGPNCPPPPNGGGPGGQPGSMPAPPIRCEGADCPQMQPGEQSPGMQPGSQQPGQQPNQQQPPEGPGTPGGGGGIAPPQGPAGQPSAPATGPGAGGSAPPGEAVPLAPPSAPAPQAPPPSEAPPSSLHNFRNFFGNILNSFGEYILGN